MQIQTKQKEIYNNQIMKKIEEAEAKIRMKEKENEMLSKEVKNLSDIVDPAMLKFVAPASPER